jgi:hypothetical protein
MSERCQLSAMRYAGTRASIAAICAWTNGGDLSLNDEEPWVTYVCVGDDDVQDPMIADPDGDFSLLLEGDYIVQVDGYFYRIPRGEELGEDAPEGHHRTYTVYELPS